MILDIAGRWTAYASLGWVYYPDGATVTSAGNEVRLKLMKVQGHSGQGRGGFAIMTAFPTGVGP